MNIERPGSPSVTILAPASKRRSTSIETRRSRLASERPPKKGVASKNAFRSSELTAIDPIYPCSRKRQVRNLVPPPRGCRDIAMDRPKPFRCTAGPADNFFHGAWYAGQPTALYRGRLPAVLSIYRLIAPCRGAVSARSGGQAARSCSSSDEPRISTRSEER